MDFNKNEPHVLFFLPYKMQPFHTYYYALHTSKVDSPIEPEFSDWDAVRRHGRENEIRMTVQCGWQYRKTFVLKIRGLSIEGNWIFYCGIKITELGRSTWKLHCTEGKWCGTSHARIKCGGWGSYAPPPPPLKNHKNIAFLRNTCPDLPINHKRTKPAINVGPFCSRTNLNSPSHQQLKQPCISKRTTSENTFWIRTCQ